MRTDETVEIPAGIVVTEDKLLLGLINEKKIFKEQCILPSEPSALSWGKELFEYYVEKGPERSLHLTFSTMTKRFLNKELLHKESVQSRPKPHPASHAE